jgi:hypothetical protein
MYAMCRFNFQTFLMKRKLIFCAEVIVVLFSWMNVENVLLINFSSVKPSMYIYCENMPLTPHK